MILKVINGNSEFIGFCSFIYLKFVIYLNYLILSSLYTHFYFKIMFICCIPNCGNTSAISKMHRFPKDSVVYRIWIEKVGRLDLLTKELSHVRNNYRVCHKHFSEEYKIPGRRGADLVKNAIPSLFLPAENMLPRWPGSTHDATIFASSNLRAEANHSPNCLLLEDDQYLQRCRTCWDAYTHQFYDLRDICYLKTTIKEAIILLVPQMVEALQDEDKVCENCKNSLETCVKFISHCLRVEAQRKSGQHDPLKDCDNTQVNEIENQQENTDLEIRENEDTGIEENGEIQNVQKDAGKISSFKNSPKDPKNSAHKPKGRNVTEDGIHNRVVSLQQSDIDKLKSLVSTFYYNNIPVYDQSVNGLTTSKRILILGSLYPGNCELCGKEFKTKVERESHRKQKCGMLTNIENHDKPNQRIVKTWQCKECLEVFQKYSNFNKHLREKHPVKCEKCNRKFFSQPSFVKHNKAAHCINRKSENFVCETCGKYFTLRHKFTSHLKVHRRNFTFVCEICGGIFDCKDILQRHMNSHKQKNIECNKCSRKFQSSKLLNKHIQRIHEPEETNNRSQCDLCGKLLKNRITLYSHRRVMHSESTDLQCPECQKIFTKNYYLKRHIAVVHGSKKKRKNPTTPKKRIIRKCVNKAKGFSFDLLPCKICGKYYKGAYNLKKHLTSHVVTKRYGCKYCDITLKNYGNLKRHEKLHMSEDETYCRCNVCWKKLNSLEELEQHMTIHKKPKNKCSECGEYFHRRFMLDNHFLLKHTTPEDLELTLETVVNEHIDIINEANEKMIANELMNI